MEYGFHDGLDEAPAEEVAPAIGTEQIQQQHPTALPKHYPCDICGQAFVS